MQDAATNIIRNVVININGDLFLPPEGLERAKVSVFDRSYLYGDSLYEVVRTYEGQFYLLDEHLRRLEKSAELCHMTLAQNTRLLSDEIHRTFEAFRALPGNRNTEAYLRLIISRGTGKIGFSLSCLTSLTQYTLIIQPVEPPTDEAFEAGMKLQISSRLRNDRRALDPAMKSGNYLNSLLAYLEAHGQGLGQAKTQPRQGNDSARSSASDSAHFSAHFDDALLLNTDLHVTEGTTFNVFYVKREILATPPLDIGILDGITRRKVIELARSIGIPVREVRFPKERLFEADEVFISSSIREIFPVTQIDRKKISQGKPGPLTRKLHHLYQDAILGTSSPRFESEYAGPV